MFETIDRVKQLLIMPLSDNPSVLYSQLTEIESLYGRLTTIAADVNANLSLARSAKLIGKDSGLSELQRQVTLDAAVSQEKRTRDIVTGLINAISQRIMLGQSLLKAQRKEGAPL